MSVRRERAVDVVVVGAGPAGLSAGRELAGAGVGAVEVLERERAAGGVPRHCAHGGFGRPWVRGPAFAERQVDAALRATAVVRTEVTATGWAGPRTLDVTSPEGLERITARAVVLATGARERPRAARLVPGTRPAGVLTTGELQQAVHLYGQRIGHRAVVVGAEPVAYAAVATLRRAGVTVAAQVTEEAPGPAATARVRLGHGIPVLTRTTVTELTGHGRLAGVRVRHADGSTAHLACDTVVFTGDFVPDHELARRGGLDLDPGTRGPAADHGFRTAEPGVFAVGNVLHAIEPAATAAAEGARAATAVRRWLSDGHWPTPGPAIEVAPPLRWITPNRLTASDGRPFALRASTLLAGTHLEVTQDDRLLHRERVRQHRSRSRSRSLTLPGAWTERVDAGGGVVRVAVRG